MSDSRIPEPVAPAGVVSRKWSGGISKSRWVSFPALASYCVLVVYAILSIYPFVWMISGALRNSQSVLNAVSPIPLHPSARYLTETWKELHFQSYLLNSVRTTGLALLVVMALYPLAAYALGVLNFRFRGVIYVLFVMLLFVPGISVLLPLVLLEHTLGLLNTRVGLSLAYANGSSPIAILLLVSYFRSLPKEMREAAYLDGATEWGIYRRIYLPLAKPALAALAIILSVGYWNEYVFASVSLASPSKFTLPLGLQSLMAAAVVHWNDVMAGSTLIVVPVIVVFIVFQRYFFSGVRGAIK